MVYLLCLMMILVPCLLGNGAVRILYGKQLMQDITLTDSVLTGWMIIIGLAEAAHLGAVVLGRSFSDCVTLFLLGLLLLLIMAAVLLLIEHYRGKRDKTFQKEAEKIRLCKTMTKKPQGMAEQIIFFVFGAMVLIQLLLMVDGGKIYPTGDMTAETVNSILATDALYGVNPMTGQAYVSGMPMRLKILCLPTLYAIVCRIFSLSAIQLVWTVVPIFTLLGCYLAFGAAAKALFPADGRKCGIFMVFVALILWVGDYMYGMDGFAVQYAGFRGISIRMVILLPYTFSLLLRKKWRIVPLCILAEACILWTLYGMGACLFVTVVMILLTFFRKRMTDLRGGEEDSTWGN